MIKEYAGDLLPALALCLPYDLFDKYFDKVLQFLYRLINKPESTVAEKSFVIGVIGETISNLDNMDQFKAVNIFKGKELLFYSKKFAAYIIISFKKAYVAMQQIPMKKLEAIQFLQLVFYVHNRMAL